LYRHCNARLIPMRPSSGPDSRRCHSLSFGARGVLADVNDTVICRIDDPKG
jgi:hypothetical protein